jgi:hypothetical protein
MKKAFLALALTLIAVPVFSMQASFKVGDGNQSRLLHEFAKNWSVVGGINYVDLHGKVGFSGNDASISGSALIPAIGVEYSMPVTKNVDVIIGGEYQQVFPSFKLDYMNNSMVNTINDAVNEVLKDTTVNCFNIYTSLNVKITPAYSLTGTTGIRLLNGSYSKNGIDLNLGLNSVYTQVGLLVNL